MHTHRLLLAVLLFTALAHAQQDANSVAGSIEGIVVDENGHALAHAEVTPDDGSPKGMIIPYYPTDAKGRFRIANLYPGEWLLFGRKLEDGYMDQDVNFAFLKGQKPLRVHVDAGSLTTGTVLRLGPRAAFVHVDLEDKATSRPITDLRIHMEQVSSPGNFLDSSQGAPADILVPATKVKLAVTSPGYSKLELH
jgi:hypothetical protein